MNDIPNGESPLSSFEDQIANQSPSVSTSDRDKLLYACAFSAGQLAGSRSTKIWRIATATLSVMLVGALVPYGAARPSIVNQQIEQLMPLPTSILEPSIVAVAPRPLKGPPRCNLDIWQIPSPDTNSLGQQLAQLSELDAHQKSLTVRFLTRAALTP